MAVNNLKTFTAEVIVYAGFCEVSFQISLSVLYFINLWLYLLSRSTNWSHAAEETTRGLSGINSVCVVEVQIFRRGHFSRRCNQKSLTTTRKHKDVRQHAGCCCINWHSCSTSSTVCRKLKHADKHAWLSALALGHCSSIIFPVSTLISYTDAQCTELVSAIIHHTRLKSSYVWNKNLSSWFVGLWLQLHITSVLHIFLYLFNIFSFLLQYLLLCIKYDEYYTIIVLYSIKLKADLCLQAFVDNKLGSMSYLVALPIKVRKLNKWV